MLAPVPSASSLTEEQIREIELEHKEWGLSEGDRFDGYLWRDISGKPYTHHPGKLIS